MKDSKKTRGAILSAATTEFAQYGFAGARVDRIADLAGYNKQLIYAHFANKQSLFNAVLKHHIQDLIENLPLDADNLPEYAAQLFDYNCAHPELARLVEWCSLENFERNPIAQITADSMKLKIVEIKAAQKRGTVSKKFSADELLSTIHALCADWLDDIMSENEQTFLSRRKTRRKMIHTIVSILTFA